MKHRGDNAPPATFSLEELPKKPGYVGLRLYENVAPFIEVVDGLTVSGYEYDEYYLELRYYDGLRQDIQNNYEMLLVHAKAEEGSTTTPSGEQGDLELRIAALEGEKADKADVQSVWDQMAAAYSEGVQEA